MVFSRNTTEFSYIKGDFSREYNGFLRKIHWFSEENTMIISGKIKISHENTMVFSRKTKISQENAMVFSRNIMVFLRKAKISQENTKVIQWFWTQILEIQ